MPDIDEDVRVLTEALAAGPMPGPWYDDSSIAHNGRVVMSEATGIRVADRPRTMHSHTCDADAAYIAAADPNRIARLLAALQSERDRADAAEARSLSASAPAAEPAWQPIETAPKAAKSLLWSARLGRHVIDGWALYCGINQPRFTHWMPLPSPPSAGGTQATANGEPS